MRTWNTDFVCFVKDQYVCGGDLGIGLLLREARKKRGLNQTQLGKILGLSPMAVSKWESGNYKM